VRWPPAKRDGWPALAVTGNAGIKQELRASRQASQSKLTLRKRGNPGLD